MSDERPEALLRSALEKIVYFEARSRQLENDVASANAEAERLRKELAHAGQREIELRRSVASLEVEVARAHREREEMGRTNEALRSERIGLLDQLLEASRIHSADRPGDEDGGVDLASFIAQLRAEVLNAGSVRAQPPASAAASAIASVEPMRGNGAYAFSLPAQTVAAPEPALAVVVARAPSSPIGGSPSASAQVATSLQATPSQVSAVAAHAERLHAAGRLHVSHEEMARLSGASAFPGRTEETLFGFSVRELSAPDPAARARAADRLRALRQSAAAPALATALHAETDAGAQVALLNAFAEVASKEGAAIVMPLLDAKSADVRITALKTLLTLDPQQAGPHLSAAMKDSDRAVRRRASLLALGLAGDAALALGEQALADSDAEVRSLGALVLGASADDRARELLLSSLRDPEKKVRKAAAQSLSRILGEDVSGVVELDEPQRRREVRRLATLPARPVTAAAMTGTERSRAAAVERAREGERAGPANPPAVRVVAPASPAPAQPAATEVASTAGGSPAESSTSAPRLLARRLDPHPGPLPEGEGVLGERLCASLVGELRISIRGRTLAELVSITGEAQAAVVEACELLVARGQVVRRGSKFFAA